MKIEFDKLIYDKDSIYTSLEVWSDYFTSIKIDESKDFIKISMDDTENINELCSEFTN